MPGDSRCRTHIDAFLAIHRGQPVPLLRSPFVPHGLGHARCLPAPDSPAASAGGGQASASVLACLERDVAAMGRVPVWITNCEGSPRERPYMLDLGEGCGTVAAHLLLGLLTHAPDRYGTTIERGSLQLLEQIGSVGLRANVNYPPVFALAVFGRLIAGLEDSTQGFLRGEAKRAAKKALRVLVIELDRAIERNVLTPQQAALLTLACLHTEAIGEA